MKLPYARSFAITALALYISVVDAVPTQHLQAKRVATIQDHAQAPVATENESSHSSCKLANSFIEILG